MVLILILSKYNSNIFFRQGTYYTTGFNIYKEESLTLDKVKLLSRYIEAFKYTKYDFFYSTLHRVRTNIITNNYRYSMLVYT
ncbi:hypothetical protein EXQ33_13970 [Clostridium botulinum]|nr:hypothetical protein [Clostridium botulinum]